MKRILAPLCWLLLLGQPALGEPAQGPRFLGPCAMRSEIVDMLSQAGEKVIWRGISSAGLLAEMWGKTGAAGTWTFTLTTPGGNTCIVSDGAIWGLTPSGQKV